MKGNGEWELTMSSFFMHRTQPLSVRQPLSQLLPLPLSRTPSPHSLLSLPLPLLLLPPQSLCRRHLQLRNSHLNQNHQFQLQLLPKLLPLRLPQPQLAQVLAHLHLPLVCRPVNLEAEEEGARRKENPTRMNQKSNVCMYVT